MYSSNQRFFVTVNPKDGDQVLQGWGTSLCWFANVIGGWSEERKNTIADLLFSRAGLRLNIVRYNIWGGDHPGHNHMRAGSKADGFMMEPGVWNWEADQNQRWMLLAARERGADLFEAFSNSPPYWMTVSECSAGAADGGSNLRHEYLEVFADYLTEVVKHYRDQYGLVFQTLDPLNEPSTSFWREHNRQEGCHFSVKEQMDIIREVKRKICQKGLNGTQISSSDENSIDSAVKSFSEFDEHVKSCISQINTHSYEGTRRKELKALAVKYGKRLWMTEYGSGGTTGHDHDSILPALDLAEQIIVDFKELRPSAWVYWQAVEDEAGTIAEDGNWGFIHADFSGNSEEYHLTKKYYAMRNFSGYIRPGYRLLRADLEHGIAFSSEDGREIVIVLSNAGLESNSYTVHLEGFHNQNTAMEVYRTSCAENLDKIASVKLAEQSVTVEAKPKSITTCVLKCQL